MRKNSGLGLHRALPLLLCVAACSQTPAYVARGQVAGFAVSTTVDHAVARDYLEGRALPARLESTRRAHLASHQHPTREQLARVSAAYSPDVAALFFADIVAARPTNHTFQKRYLDSIQALAAGWTPSVTEMDSLVVLFAPGWFYRSHGSETGADFAEPRAQLAGLGVRTELIPTAENGAVEANAQIVADAVRTHRNRHHRVIVVSASKSSAEVALALGELLQPAETSHVAGWLSIGGVLRGSPFADRMLEPDVCWLARARLAVSGFDMAGLESMQTRRQRDRFTGFRFSDHIFRVTYVPVPLSGDITDRAESGYESLRPHGPNDGLTLLADELIPGGVVLLEPGTDHFLKTTHGGRRWRTLGLLVVMLEAVRQQDAPTASAARQS